MLVLNRRRNQRIFIGENIIVTVVEIRKDGSVRLGIEAPPDVPVDREEIAVAKALTPEPPAV